jgi:hypothetical protein
VIPACVGQIEQQAAEGENVEMNGETKFKHYSGSDQLNLMRDHMEIKPLYQQESSTSKFAPTHSLTHSLTHNIES